MAGQPLRHRHHWGRFGLGALLVLAPVFYWDSSRWVVAPSPWDLSVRHYGALHLLLPSQWPARVDEWATLLWYFTASWPVWLGVILILIFSYHRDKGFLAPQPPPVVWWLLLWGSGFLLLHIVTSVQIWDRYLLPMAPLFCWLVAWAFSQVDKRLLAQRSLHWSAVGGLVSLLLLAPPAVTAARGRLPIGGDHGDYMGLTEAVAWLKQHAPTDSILYQQALGWHYQFYFYDELAAHHLALRWFPTATYLAANAARSPAFARFLVLPDWAPQPALPLQLAVRHIDLNPLAHFGRMTLYTLQNQPQPRGQPDCTWCICQPRRLWPIWSSPIAAGESIQP